MFQHTSGQLWCRMVPLSYTTCIFVLLMLIQTQAAFSHEVHKKHPNHFDKSIPRFKQAARATLYVVPIALETFVPVRPDTIKRDADKVAFLNTHDLTIFYHILSGTAGISTFNAAAFSRALSGEKKTQSFNPSATRLRLEDGDKPPVLIDQQGVVLYGDKEYSLTPLAFVELDHFVAGLKSSK